MHSLVDPLRQVEEVSRLGIVCADSGCPAEQIELNGVDYFAVPQSRMAVRTRVGLRRDENRCLRTFVDIIRRFRPDLIHIHGTERFFGRLKVDNLINVPTVVSIQGLMRPCATYAWGEKTVVDMLPLTNLWEVTRMFPTLSRRQNYIRRARLEEKTISAVDGVIGRTSWDRSYCWQVAPHTPYFHVDEMLRSEFFGPRWSAVAATRHRVYASGRLTFAKGMHVLLDGMALVKRQYPDLQVRIAGDDTATPEFRYIRRRISQLGLEDSVRLLGWISGQQIVEELKAARCYVNTSFIENGCNALQEAMLVGCPCVATFTGGMVTTLSHRKTGLMVPIGCVHMYADAVKELFDDDALCESLGSEANQVARDRHNPQLVLRQLLTAYRALVGTTSSQAK